MKQLSNQDIERRLAQVMANRTVVIPEKLISDLLGIFGLSAEDADDESVSPTRKATVRERIPGGQRPEIYTANVRRANFGDYPINQQEELYV